MIEKKQDVEIEKNSKTYQLITILANLPEEFRKEVIKLFDKYSIGGFTRRKEHTLREGLIEIFCEYESESEIVDCHYLQLINLIFDRKLDPEETNDISVLVARVKEKISSGKWAPLIMIDRDTWVKISKFIKKDFYEKPRNVQNMVNNLEMKISEIEKQTTISAEDFSIQNTLDLARAVNCNLVNPVKAKRVAIQYINESKQKLKGSGDTRVLGCLLPLAMCNDYDIQSNLIEFALYALKKSPSNHKYVYRWLTDVLNSVIHRNPDLLPRAMLYRAFVNLLNRLPIEEQSSEEDTVLYYVGQNELELVKYFEALQTVMEAAYATGFKKVYDALKTRLTLSRKYIEGRGKSIEESMFVKYSNDFIKELDKRFKGDKTTFERIQLFASPISGIALGASCFSSGVANLIISEGTNINAWKALANSSLEIAINFVKLYKLLPERRAKWYGQFQAIQALVYSSIIIDDPWRWHATSSILQEMAAYSSEKVLLYTMKFIMNLCLEKPELWKYCKPVLETYRSADIGQSEKIVIHASAYLQVFNEQIEGVNERTAGNLPIDFKMNKAREFFHDIRNIAAKFLFSTKSLEDYLHMLQEEEKNIEKEIGRYVQSISDYNEWIEKDLSEQSGFDPLLAEIIKKEQTRIEIKTKKEEKLSKEISTKDRTGKVKIDEMAEKEISAKDRKGKMKIDETSDEEILEEETTSESKEVDKTLLKLSSINFQKFQSKGGWFSLEEESKPRIPGEGTSSQAIVLADKKPVEIVPQGLRELQSEGSSNILNQQEIRDEEKAGQELNRILLNEWNYKSNPDRLAARGNFLSEYRRVQSEQKRQALEQEQIRKAEKESVREIPISEYAERKVYEERREIYDDINEKRLQQGIMNSLQEKRKSASSLLTKIDLRKEENAHKKTSPSVWENMSISEPINFSPSDLEVMKEEAERSNEIINESERLFTSNEMVEGFEGSFTSNETENEINLCRKLSLDYDSFSAEREKNDTNEMGEISQEALSLGELQKYIEESRVPKKEEKSEEKGSLKKTLDQALNDIHTLNRELRSSKLQKSSEKMTESERTTMDWNSKKTQAQLLAEQSIVSQGNPPSETRNLEVNRNNNSVSETNNSAANNMINTA